MLFPMFVSSKAEEVGFKGVTARAATTPPAIWIMLLVVVTALAVWTPLGDVKLFTSGQPPHTDLFWALIHEVEILAGTCRTGMLTTSQMMVIEHMPAEALAPRSNSGAVCRGSV
jgi:hypothetical protein